MKPEDISSSYTYKHCTLWYIFVVTLKRICLSYEIVTMEVLKLTPPFTYSYQCGSTILTSYIPVYMYSVSIQIIIDLFRVIIIFQTKYENIPKTIQSIFDLNLQQMDSSKIISNLMNSMILLLSFGLSSPVLSVSISLGMMVNISCWLMVIGKSIFQNQNGNQNGNENEDKVRNSVRNESDDERNTGEK